MSTIARTLLPCCRHHNSHLQRRAALDIGSEQIKMQVSDVNLRTNEIEKILFTDCVTVQLQDNLKNRNLSNFIQNETVHAIAQLVKKASFFKTQAYHGIATEALRSAQNSEELITQIQKDTGVPITVISQEEEGILGFVSATYNRDEDLDKAVVWDWGRGSFQLVTKFKNDFCVYGDRFLNLNTQFTDIPEPILEKIDLNNGAVLGLGMHPLWGMPNNEYYDQARILREKILTPQNPNLIFAHTFMQAIGIKQVHYVATEAQNAVGALLNPKYW